MRIASEQEDGYYFARPCHLRERVAENINGLILVPAKRNVLWGPDQGTSEAERVETEQQAEKEGWIFNAIRIYFYTS